MFLSCPNCYNPREQRKDDVCKECAFIKANHPEIYDFVLAIVDKAIGKHLHDYQHSDN